jgi:hypothetical protein
MRHRPPHHLPSTRKGRIVTTSLEAAAEAIHRDECLVEPPEDCQGPNGYNVGDARAALDAIDPRLKFLTPEDVTAILDHYRESLTRYEIGERVWEVMGR